ncbi:MAG: crossover junction endodeoxyribonuclease RuvC [Desulfobulbaceae bacterium]|nr:crossover junction endodeoxyribonuclease RuvC [Desulfobulbaceae bacterium]
MRILGIDPGSRITGYGLIESRRNQLEFIACGTIRTAGEANFSRRLLVIFSDISEVISSYAPEVAAVEEVFVARDPRAALKLGHARGAAVVAALHQGVEVFNYSPRRVKQTVAGYGQADKAQIQYMVRMLLRLNAAPSSDAADALALAICHAHHSFV